jgi:hypothetical protein
MLEFLLGVLAGIFIALAIVTALGAAIHEEE